MPPRTRRFSARLADMQLVSDVEQDDDIDVENDDEEQEMDDGDAAGEEEEEENDEIQSVHALVVTDDGQFFLMISPCRKMRTTTRNLSRHLGSCSLDSE